MDRTPLIFKAAFAALLISASGASATLVCPGGQVFPDRGPGDTEYCPVIPQPEPDPIAPGDVTNTNTNLQGQAQGQAQGQGQSSVNTNTATGGAGGTGVGHGGAGGSAQVGDTSATGGNATGGASRASSRAEASGGNARSKGGDARSRAHTGNVRNRVDASTRVQSSANAVNLGAAVIGSTNPCMIGGGLGGSSIGATFGGNFGVIDKACASSEQRMREVVLICQTSSAAACNAAKAYASPLMRAALVASGEVREKAPGGTVAVAPSKEPKGFNRAMNAAQAAQQAADGRTPHPTPGLSCPAGSAWDGRGCKRR